MQDDIRQIAHWIPDPDALRREGEKSWRTCPVTIAAAAMLDDDELDRLAGWLAPETPFMEKMAFSRLVRQHVPAPPADGAADLWTGVHRIVFHAWADRRFIAMVDFGKPPASDLEGYRTRYADGHLVLGSGNPDDRHSVIPDTVLAAAAGSPMTALLPHPMFDGLHWADDQDPGVVEPIFGKGPATPRPATMLKGPEVDIPLGVDPGARFAQFARERRAGFAA